MNKTLYKQTDSRWSSKPYPTKASSFGGTGCGCVACTHIVIEQDKYKNYTPENLRPWMISQGFAVAGQGTTWSGIPKTLQHYGYLNVVHIGINDPMTKAWTELNKGNRIGVILFKSGKAPNGTVWTASGHYVAFTDYYVKNGKHYFYTKDSGPRNHDSLTNGYYSYENSMKGTVYQMWIVQRLDTPSPTPTPTPTPTPKDPVTVDGKFGNNSVKALQKVLGTYQDGIISGQSSSLKKYHTGFNGSVQYGKGGSACIKALQKKLGLSSPDGQLGPNTIKAFQKYLDMSNPDGYWGPNTSKAVQKWLNTKLNSNNSSSSSSTSTKIKGMDISAWQGNISTANFKKAKDAGIKFVILRLGYTGSSSKKPTIDKVFENNYKNAIAVGLPVGVYYYSLATTNAEAKNEANFCIANLKGKTITYPVYIDMEDNEFQAKKSKSVLASVCNTFCDAIKTAGYIPGVYASLNWFNNKIGNITSTHSKWVAQYNKTCDYKGVYDMWQYSSSEPVTGIANKVDVNWCYKKF